MSAAAAGLFSPVASALSVAIFYGLWQGILIWLITAGTLAAMSRRSAQSRYVVACLALALMLAAFAVTFSVTLINAVKVDAFAPAAGPGRPHLSGVNLPPLSLEWWLADFGHRPLGNGGSPLPFEGLWLGVAWLVGAAVVALSGVFQFAAVRRLLSCAHFDVSDRWRDAFEAVSRDLRLDRLARLGHSAAVEVPTVVGWLAPAVLVPLPSYTALSRDEMCAILAHELSHIRRHDYLVNAVQQVVEVFLFFHPVTWWLSHRIREEREYCCDDVAVQYTNSALGYARALSQLETLRTQRPGYAMGADGGSLMNRITRILGAKPERRHLSTIGGVVAVLAMAMVAMAFLAGNGGIAFAGGGSPTPGPKAQPTAQVDKNDAIMAAIRSALNQLVANGTIHQSQAETIEQDMASGSIDPQALVADGVMTVAQMQAVRDALGQVKQSFATTSGATIGSPKTAANGRPACDAIGRKLAQAVKDGRLTQEQANLDQQLAGCTTGDTSK